MLVEAAVAEVRQATQHANKHVRDAAQKANEELQRLQSQRRGSTNWYVVISSGGGGN